MLCSIRIPPRTEHSERRRHGPRGIPHPSWGWICTEGALDMPQSGTQKSLRRDAELLPAGLALGRG